MRFVFLTTQDNYALALRMAADALRRENGVDLTVGVYSAPSLLTEADWQRVAQDVKKADFVVGAMLFGEAYVRPIEPILTSATCPVCVVMSNPTLIRQTRIGKFSLRKPEELEKDESGQKNWLRAFQPKQGHHEVGRQMKLVGGLSKMLKFLPGKFRDLHTYIAMHQFWIHNTPDNLRRMLAMLVERYVPGYKGKLKIEDPQIYPDTALVHPDSPTPFADLNSYQKWLRKRKVKLDKGVVGLLTLRVIVLGENIRHLNALVRALEARNLEVRLGYTSGLDERPAMQQFMSDQHGAATVDMLATTTGFSLVGGMAQSRADEAVEIFQKFDRPCLDLIPLVFQGTDQWLRDERGLSPMHLAMNVALPELDGMIEPFVYGGPNVGHVEAEPVFKQVERIADRIARRVQLRHTPIHERKLAIVLFNYPPNLGNAGTAAYLDVFASIFHLLKSLKTEGYDVQVPATADDLRRAIIEGNALIHGTEGNVADTLAVADYRRLFPDHVDIEPYWGSAPGTLLNDGKRFFILGRQFGKVFIGIQPGFGYERDPMRLLMAKDAAPHHGFAAFYTWLDKVFGANAVLHFGTHGALEFMPGKQAGLGPECWPPRLLGALPNVYYYCVNNPSEGTIARRRGMATLVSYLVPPVQQAGLYKGLRLLKDDIDRFRQQPQAQLLDDIRLQAERLQVIPKVLPPENEDDDGISYVTSLAHELIQVEQRLIPIGLHVMGVTPAPAERADILAMVATFARPTWNGATLPSPLPVLVAQGMGHNYTELTANLGHNADAQTAYEKISNLCLEAVKRFVNGGAANGGAAAANALLAQYVSPAVLAPLWGSLGDLDTRLCDEQETAGLLRALRGGYLPPSPGNDVVRNPGVVPTGRNIHGLDPYRIPSPAAQVSGARLVTEMLDRTRQEQGGYPETVALILWGTDNLKTDGEGVAEALALVGARAVTDELGKIASVELIPLEELGRPRIDIIATASGIFRDLMAQQAQLIDQAVRQAAAATNEPLDLNFVRKHVLAQAAELGITPNEAAQRVFSNASGTYGANVNQLVESSTWEDESQLSEVFMNRKSFALTPNGEWRESRPLMERVLATVDVTFQNVDSVETGISDVDHYYEYLGGMTKSVEMLRGGKRPSVLVSEAFSATGTNRVQSLEQMVRLETRAKLLNPKWYEGMLNHGYEGVHEIEIRVSNTYGWSATTDAVDGWVYQGVADTFVLDAELRERMAKLNPHATTALARRLLEAHSRGFWDADEATLEQLRDIYADLEDRLEGVV